MKHLIKVLFLFAFIMPFTTVSATSLDDTTMDINEHSSSSHFEKEIELPSSDDDHHGKSHDSSDEKHDEKDEQHDDKDEQHDDKDDSSDDKDDSADDKDDSADDKDDSRDNSVETGHDDDK